MSEFGKYLVIEGLDGAGKSTQAHHLAEHLRADGLSVVEMIEPGTTPIGKELRRIILDPNIEMLPETELDLFGASRRETVNQIIRPAVQGGETVIGDRNWFSSVATQGFAKGLPVQDITEQTKRVMGDHFMPDGAVIIDLPSEVAKARLSATGTKADRFEQEGREFFDAVRRVTTGLRKRLV